MWYVDCIYRENQSRKEISKVSPCLAVDAVLHSLSIFDSAS